MGKEITSTNREVKMLRLNKQHGQYLRYELEPRRQIPITKNKSEHNTPASHGKALLIAYVSMKVLWR
jgi:hypothetical protein